MGGFTLQGWRLVLEGHDLGTMGRAYFDNGFASHDFEPAGAFAAVEPVFDRVNRTWSDWWNCDDDAESDRLCGLHEPADRERVLLPLRLVSPDGAVSLADAVIHVETRYSPPRVRVKLGKSAYQTLRAAGLLPPV